MSIQFDWAVLDKELVQRLTAKLNETIQSRGNVRITELVLGKEAPEIDFLELDELSVKHVKTSINVAYRGDASITIFTNSQLNPLVSTLDLVGERGRFHTGMLDAHIPFYAPLHIRLSNFVIQGNVVISFQDPFVEISLKNEALRGVQINSSFDGCLAASSKLEHRVRSELQRAFRAVVETPIRLDLNSLKKPETS